MRFRWTMKELKESSDTKILCDLVAERMGGLNVYAPLYKRLRAIYDRLTKKFAAEADRKERAATAASKS